MSYTIYYGEKNYAISGNPRRAWLTWLCFGCFLLLVWSFWPEGQEVLCRMLLPGDAESAMEAAEVFAQALQCGLSFSDAAELFCIQVVNSAGLGG